LQTKAHVVIDIKAKLKTFTQKYQHCEVKLSAMMLWCELIYFKLLRESRVVGKSEAYSIHDWSFNDVIDA
jgi:hypothetical protein